VTAKSEGPANGALLIIGGLITPIIRNKAIELGGPQWVVIPTAGGGVTLRAKLNWRLHHTAHD
jgi:hypothetical protein